MGIACVALDAGISELLSGLSLTRFNAKSKEVKWFLN
jgi:hypothetical protein